jgi:hypothetical protein
VVFDSTSPWSIAELAKPFPNVTVLPLAADGGQLSALRTIHAIKSPSSGLIFLQHSTRLTRCVADIVAAVAQRNCAAAHLAGETRMDGFWSNHKVAGEILKVLGAPYGLSPSWNAHNLSVAEHGTIYLDAEGWARSSAELERPAAVALFESRLIKANKAQVGQGVEALAGFLVWWANRRIVPAVDAPALTTDGCWCCCCETNRGQRCPSVLETSRGPDR